MARPRRGTGARRARRKASSATRSCSRPTTATNPKTIKNYLDRAARHGGGTSCPGGAPTITHTASNQTTRLDLKPTATIADDKGLKDAPLFYYSFTNPGATPNLSTMTQLTTAQESRQQHERHVGADAAEPGRDGRRRHDEDDLLRVRRRRQRRPDGQLRSLDESPVYTMTVTAGGTSTAGVCSACTADSQCGTGNECVYMGSMGDSYCLQGCGGGLPDRLHLLGVADLLGRRQARATSACRRAARATAPTGACVDDTCEENDYAQRGVGEPDARRRTSIDYVELPEHDEQPTAADDDWYKIVLTADVARRTSRSPATARATSTSTSTGRTAR